MLSFRPRSLRQPQPSDIFQLFLFIDALRPTDDRFDHSLRLRTVFGVLAAVLGVGFGIAGAHFSTIGGFDMDLY